MRKRTFILFTFFWLLANNFTSFCYGQIKTANNKNIGFSEMDIFIRKQMDSLKIPGASIAIINKGKITYERSFGYANTSTQKKVDSSTIFEAASMSKPVFGYFLLKMMQDGVIKIDLDQPVYQYCPYTDIAYDERYKLITARMLLTHTSGLPNQRQNDTLTIQFTPGTKYAYSGEGYEYLKKAVEALTHTNSNGLDSLVQKEVVVPLGMKHFSYIANTYMTAQKAYGYFSTPNENNGKFKPIPTQFGASYSLHTNTNDYAKFLIDIMNNKQLNKAYVDSLLKPRVRLMRDGKPTSTYYGFGFGMDSSEYGVRYQHTGNNGDFTGGFIFFLDKKLGVVVFTNGDNGVHLYLKLADLITNGDRQ